MNVGGRVFSSNLLDRRHKDEFPRLLFYFDHRAMLPVEKVVDFISFYNKISCSLVCSQMILTGRIIHYNKNSGRGAIGYGNLSLTFGNSDVINFDAAKIRNGLQVEFEMWQTAGSQYKRAKGIFVKYKLAKFVQDNSQNWEQIEEIVDGFQTKTVSSAELSFVDTTNDNSKQEKIESNLVALALFDNKIRLVSLTKDGEYSFLDQGRKYHNILYPSVIEEASLELAIEEFEDLINSPKASENDFQKFLESNPGFILNDEYKTAHPHIILSKENKEKLIPDFVLEPVNQSEFCDLLELKLPSAQIYVMKKNREHYSAAISEAAAQLRTYGNFFDEEKNRNNFQQIYPHLKIYKPRMFLIIGRQNNEDAMIKRQIQSEHPQLVLKNFDDLLARMKWKQEKLKNRNKLFQ